MTRALITGITGQDGSLLAERLIAEGVEVVGLTRRDATPAALPNLAAVADRVSLVWADLRDAASLSRAVEAVGADEIYHLAAPSFVPASWDDPARTLTEIVVATAAILKAAGRARVVVAASSEVFGDTDESPQRESSLMRPRTPYGVAKLAVLHAARVYGASAAITYNHESERRPEQFVTRKVTKGAAAIKLGLQDELVLGDLEAVRDWSAARDVVAGLRLMARAEEAGEYVLASGEGRTVAELASTAFAAVGLESERYVRVDPALVRAPERVAPVGDSAKARERLGWRREIPFDELIGGMVEADLARLSARAA